MTTSNDSEDKTDIHIKNVDSVFTEEIDEAEKRLIHSIDEMENGLAEMGINQYDLDNLASTFLDVYDIQQQKYISENTFILFSFVGMALLELGVIVECDDDNYICK